MDVFCLRVKKEHAGKVFPFDRVYFAKNGEHTVFKGMFRYALVLPVEATLKNLLKDYVKIDAGESHEFKRDDAALAPNNEEWQELLDAGDWVMAVPILAKYVKANMPLYLTAAGKYRASTEEENKPAVAGRKFLRRRMIRAEGLADPFPTLTYLQTPEQNIRPVCVACPRFILHQNGHCHLGEDICYSSLALGVHNHFEEGMAAPTTSENILLTAED